MIGIAALLALAQPGAEAAVREADAAFWRAFHACDAAAMGGFFTEDAEFYHDLTGLTAGRAAVVGSLHRGPCGTPGTRVRREPVEGTIRVDPIPGFGAMISGEHRFLTTEGSGPERATGEARFAHVWRLEEGRWRMRRVLSYAHGPARYVPPAAVAVPAEVLARLAGRYRGERVGDILVTVEGAGLKLVAGGLALTLRPASETEFVAAERDLRFRFTADGLSVVENGAVAEQARRID